MRTALRLAPYLLACIVAVAAYLFFGGSAGKRAYVPRERTRLVTVLVEVTRTPDPADRIVVYVTPTPSPLAPSPTATPVVRAERILEQYGNDSYQSLSEMPPELFHYYSTALNEVGAYFDVRPEDLLAVVQAQNGGRIVLRNERTEGVAGLPRRAWNGWAFPFHDRYLSDVRLIAQHGGLGFDWRQRTMWSQWVAGRTDSSNLNGAEATPDDFTDSIAALANYLARAGVTATAAERDPGGATDRLEGALAELRAGTFFTLPPVGEEQTPYLSEPLRAAFNRALDQTWGVQLTDPELLATVDRSAVAAQVAAGLLEPEEAALRLVSQFTDYYLMENQRRQEEGLPAIWPFIADELTLRTQLYAVRAIGHPLAMWEAREILRTASNDRPTVESRIAGRTDARLFGGARTRLDETLQRSARGVPLSTREVAELVYPLLEHRTHTRMSSVAVQEVMERVEYQLRTLPEYQEQHGKQFFAANPLEPWPQNIGQRFGAPASYQPGGRHTGVDVRGTRDGGRQPVLYAVDDAVVAHVGPLYCLGPNVCRGPYAIVLDHGNNIYSIYSHNSEAWVESGDSVSAGEGIGRQGSEGYSRGSHLHFEIHVGAPYTGDWTQPFRGGEFINPLPWLPRDLIIENG